MAIAFRRRFGSLARRPSVCNVLRQPIRNCSIGYPSSGWNRVGRLKQLLRNIVLSSTYQQSSGRFARLRERDPENLLFARFARQRVDAEVLRDCMLASSDLLSSEIGGPAFARRSPPPYRTRVMAVKRGPSRKVLTAIVDRFTHFQTHRTLRRLPSLRCSFR